MARLSQLFDPLNKITLDAVIRPKSQGERQLAANHLLHLMPNVNGLLKLSHFGSSDLSHIDLLSEAHSFPLL